MQLTKRHNPTLRMEKILTELGHVLDSGWTFLGFIAVVLLNLLVPVKFNLSLIAFLIFADIVTALIALFMEKKRHSASLGIAFRAFYIAWTSKRAFDSLPKFFFYCLLILGGYYIGVLFGSPEQYSKVATALICYVEIRSIIENGDKAFNTNMLELVGEQLKKLLPSKK